MPQPDPIHVHTAGARTRNVVNIANPGGTVAAYTLTDNQDAPTADSDGFRNFRSQKMLHVLAKSTANQTMTITVYAYNSSLGGTWAPLSMPISQGNGNAMVFKEISHEIAVGNVTTQYIRFAIPIEGAERIAIQATKGGSISAGNVQIYLGVNTI